MAKKKVWRIEVIKPFFGNYFHRAPGMGLCGSSELPYLPLPFPRVGEVLVFEQIAEGGYSVVFKGAANSSSYAVKRMICVEVVSFLFFFWGPFFDPSLRRSNWRWLNMR